jgi:hypothetical protein
MARLAVSVLFLALLVLETSAQSGDTLIDDADYESLYDFTGSGESDETDETQPDLEWYEPEIQPDANWTKEICTRYRQGSIDFFYDAMYQFHRIRYPVPDDYNLNAVQSELNEYYPRPSGDQICQGRHFASNFSILFKFKAEERLRFTLLNISDESGDKFSVVIDMIQNSVTLAFSDCRTLQVIIPLGDTNPLQTGVWHRLAIAVDLSFIVVYLDCNQVHTHVFVSDCTVVCDETVEIGMLESEFTGTLTVTEFVYFPDSYAEELSQTGAARFCTDLDRAACGIAVETPTEVKLEPVIDPTVDINFDRQVNDTAPPVAITINPFADIIAELGPNIVIPGDEGAPGERGYGFRGLPGPKGVVGRQGLVGDYGLPGQPGYDGRPGDSGISGVSGAIGLPGLPGPPGATLYSQEVYQDIGAGGKGPLNDFTGPIPLPVGQPGDSGPIGTEGSMGQYGGQGYVGPPGTPGNDGPPGPRGPPGTNGFPGPDGRRVRNPSTLHTPSPNYLLIPL